MNHEAIKEAIQKAIELKAGAILQRFYNYKIE